jgi:2-methylcitrate dehydratase PrpD
MGAPRRRHWRELQYGVQAKASLRAADAALVNGTAAHAFELEHYHNAKLHPGAVVVPAAIAMAEKTE